MTDILNISLSSVRDKEPLEMVSGEQLRKWRALEAEARLLVYNKYLACGTLRPILDRMERTLILPARQHQRTDQEDQST